MTAPSCPPPLPRNFPAPPCYAGKLEGFIDADGRLYPCYLLIGRYPAPNVRTGGFRQAWDQLPAPAGCAACFSACSIEHNYIHDLHLPVLGHQMLNVLQRK